MKTKKLVCYNCGGHGFITTIYESGQTSTICPVCGGIGTHEIQMTNADCIRAMSDEELAEFLWNFNLADVSTDKLGEFGPHMFRYRLKEWLKMPAEEDDYEQ